MLVLSFVGLSQPGEEDENGDENGEEASVEMGAELYEENCLSCHGDDMEGETGPAIAGDDPDTVLSAIEEGPGTMPEDLVTGEEAEAVAEYVSEGGE
nr:cytochrome c [Geomicrobium halophilum]